LVSRRYAGAYALKATANATMTKISEMASTQRVTPILEPPRASVVVRLIGSGKTILLGECRNDVAERTVP